MRTARRNASKTCVRGHPFVGAGPCPACRPATLRRRLRSLEESLLQPEVRRSRAALERLLAEEFVEVASTGRVYRKEDVVAGLLDEAPTRRALTDFKVSLLAPDVALATFRLIRHAVEGQEPVRSLRSSIWRWRDGGWTLVYHQGTLLTGKGPGGGK